MYALGKKEREKEREHWGRRERQRQREKQRERRERQGEIPAFKELKVKRQDSKTVDCFGTGR